MSSIVVKNLTFEYEGGREKIFDNVSFSLDSSWKTGLIGRNGRGKTTFLNLLLGKYEYGGQIISDLAFSYFPYEVSNPKALALEILQGIAPQAEDWEFIREASLLDVDAEAIYRSFNTLSNGEQTKLLLAALFLNEGKFLLIDEPTNHLDIEARHEVSKYLKSKSGFILVSHDRTLLDDTTDHIMAINRNDVEIVQGNYSSWWENRNRQNAFEEAENAKIKKEISHLNDAAKRNATWADKVEKSKFGQTNSGSKIDRGFVSHKSSKMMQKAKNQERRISDALTKQEGLLKNVEESEDIKIFPLDYHSDTLIEGQELSKKFNDRTLFEDLTFKIRRGDRAVIQGKNGSGKSTLLKMIIGEDDEYDGMLKVGSGLTISYLPQTASFSGSLEDFALSKGIDRTLLFTMLRKLGFERYEFENRLESLSEGQKKKVMLSASLCEQAHIYIWDEPLNFIDVISRSQIEDLILKYQPTLLFVEHDEYFTKKIATREIHC